jgi:carboxymethylenebutenolidase
LVLHAWWGLNNTIKAVCTQLAEAGFVAFAPDLYHGKVANTIADAEALGNALDANYLQAKAEVAETTRFLNERAGSADRDLAVIGFSLGASYALDISNTAPEYIRSVVIFYGTWVDDLSNSHAAYLGHFAENDPFEPPSNVDRLEEYLRRVSRPVTFYRYSGTGHWFFEPDRSDAYHRKAATLAWERTLLTRGDLRLVLSAPNPAGRGGQPMPDGTSQRPGGWNRFTIEVSDLTATVEFLCQADVHFRNEIVTGVGGKQIILDDPSGNPIELFEPTIPEARLSSSSGSTAK